MKMLIVLPVILVSAIASAEPCGWLDASVNDSGLVSIEAAAGDLQLVAIPPDWVDVVIVRSIDGTCQNPVVVSTDTTWPLIETGGQLMIEWSEQIPSPNQHYRYEIMARNTTAIAAPSPTKPRHGEI